MTTGDQKSKHKPSGKVTLDEVLKSLQDMIHTDLLEGEHAPKTPPAEKPSHTPSEDKPPKGREAPTIEDFASPSPASGPVNLGAVMRSLKDLVNNELNVGDEASSSDDDTRPESQELHETEAEASPEIETSPAGAEDDFLESLASLSEDVSLPAPEAIAEPASPATEMEAVVFEAAAEEIEAAPLPADTSDMVPPNIPEPEEIAFEVEMPEFKTESELVEVAPLPFDASDTTITPASESLVTSGAEGEVAKTERPAAESIHSSNGAPPAGLQQELLLDEAPVQTEAPTVAAPEPIPVAVADSNTTSAAETPTPLESANIGTLSAELSIEPESPPEFLMPDAVLEIPDIENTQGPSTLDKAVIDIEIDAPVEKTQNTPTIDFDAITLDEPSQENVSAASAATALATESTPVPSTTPASIEEIKIETPAPQAMSMPSIDFNPASPEKPKEESQPAALSPAPLTLQNDMSMPSVEFSPSPAIPAKAVQEKSPDAEDKTPAAEPSRKSATASVEPPQPPKHIDIPEQTAATSEKPPAPENNLPTASVEFSPSPATAAQPAQEIPPAAENNISIIEPVPEPAAAPVETPKPPTLDDIPVLKDVVDPATGKMTAKEHAVETPPSSPDRTRDAVIRAIAKLNIELRKTGGSGLDPKLINRLQQYMREELEKSAKKEE